MNVRRLRRGSVAGADSADFRSCLSRRRSKTPHHAFADKEQGRLVVEDNGVGMSRDEMIDALGAIARSGTKAFLDRIAAAQGKEWQTWTRPR